MRANPEGESDMTTAIYARFSSDKQSEKSIEDQVARCREIAARYGATITEVYADEALSGASMANRPRVQRLIEKLRSGRLDIIVTESLDRLSRDQADLTRLYRDTKIYGTRLITAVDGEILDDAQGILQVGLRAMVAEIYLKDLADKTRRGQLGVARDGRIPGGRSYGYRKVDGEQNGLREIAPEEAAIVIRIYEEYATGCSPRAIVKRLNAENIPGPRGNIWRVSTVLGNARRQNGILSNPLYNGELVFNRQHKVKNPETGKCRMVPNPESEWIRVPMEELRIVQADLFGKVRAMREAMSGTKPTYHRRPKRVLAGLVKCGVCGGTYRTVATERYGCANRRDNGTCDNARTIAIDNLETRVFDGLRNHLLAPEAVEYAVACYRERMGELAGDAAAKRRRLEAQLSQRQGTISMAQRHVANGEMPPQWLYDAATTAENELKSFRAEIEALDAPRVVELHPNASRKYRDVVAGLNERLAAADDNQTRMKAINALRALVTAIIVSPGGKRGEVHIAIEGDLAALLEIQESGGSVVEMGAGVGFEPTTFRL